jgi:hypothetical protein
MLQEEAKHDRSEVFEQVCDSLEYLCRENAHRIDAFLGDLMEKGELLD